jgi:hypothetical protein
MTGGSLMPGIQIALVRQDGTMTARTPALVDSGCDLTTFPVEWAHHLGIDFDACEKIAGLSAAGATDADDENAPRVWEPGVEAIILGRKIRLGAVFRPNLPIILLGRDDFFHTFKVSFDQRRKTFTVEPYDDET